MPRSVTYSKKKKRRVLDVANAALLSQRGNSTQTREQFCNPFKTVGIPPSTPPMTGIPVLLSDFLDGSNPCNDCFVDKLHSFKMRFTHSVQLFSTLSAVLTLVNGNEVITVTNTNTMSERSMAIVEQEAFIQTVLLDALQDTGKYYDLINDKNIEFPPALMQFYAQLNTYPANSFPTSLFVQSFPFNEFQTFITNFPWVETYMEELSMTTFRGPDDYAVMTVTKDADVTVSSRATATTTAATGATSTVASVTQSTITSTSSNTSLSNSSTLSSSSESSNSRTTPSSSASSTGSTNAAGLVTPYVPQALFLGAVAVLL